jgi:hypothetical protein
MKAFEKENHRQPCLAIPKPATEPQAVISRGEEILDRAHRLAHEIEEQVQQALHAPAYASPNPSNPSRS